MRGAREVTRLVPWESTDASAYYSAQSAFIPLFTAWHDFNDTHTSTEQAWSARKNDG